MWVELFLVRNWCRWSRLPTYLYSNKKVKLAGEGHSSDHERISDQKRTVNAAEMFLNHWNRSQRKIVGFFVGFSVLFWKTYLKRHEKMKYLDLFPYKMRTLFNINDLDFAVLINCAFQNNLFHDISTFDTTYSYNFEMLFTSIS